MIKQEMFRDNYSISIEKESVRVLKDYPHIASVLSNVGNVYIKELKNNDAYICLLEKVYRNIAKKESFNVPLLTKQSKYICRLKHRNFVVFEELEETDEIPSAEWWANTLYEIHSLPIEAKDEVLDFQAFFSVNSDLYLAASKFMPNDIKQFVNELLLLVDYNHARRVNKVVNHGDPLRSNIMKKNDEFCLIDFESVCWVPKEYDLQRHLWDFAINTDKNEIETYYKNFTAAYQFHKKVDINLLRYVLILDFCRTICWLYVICSDFSRSDLARQEMELSKCVTAIKDGKINKLLECMRC